MHTILKVIEIVAGLALAVVAGLIFVTVVMRYGFAVNVPDSFDLARYLQGIAILWGLSVATFHKSHISVDIMWEVGGPRLRHVIDIVAAAVTAAFFCVFAWQLFDRLPSFIASNQVTSDMRLLVWPFYLMAIAGVASTALVALVVLLRTIVTREKISHG